MPSVLLTRLIPTERETVGSNLQIKNVGLS